MDCIDMFNPISNESCITTSNESYTTPLDDLYTSITGWYFNDEKELERHEIACMFHEDKEYSGNYDDDDNHENYERICMFKEDKEYAGNHNKYFLSEYTVSNYSLKHNHIEYEDEFEGLEEDYQWENEWLRKDLNLKCEKILEGDNVILYKKYKRTGILSFVEWGLHSFTY